MGRRTYLFRRGVAQILSLAVLMIVFNFALVLFALESQYSFPVYMGIFLVGNTICYVIARFMSRLIVGSAPPQVM